MNQITHEVLNDRIRDIEEVIEKSGKTNQAEIKQLIIKEATKLIQELAPKGIGKEDLLKHLEDIFGKNNFANGKYKGGKDFVVETIKELLGKGNFEGNNFVGGWNEEKDTANINKLFNPLKKDVEDKLTTAKKEVDTKLIGVDTKLSEADKEIKSKLQTVDTKLKEVSTTIETKFGGSDKFKEGVYQFKDLLVKAVIEELKVKGLLRDEIHDFFDPENFYPDEPKKDDNVPKGREGKWKNAKDQAMMKAKFDAEIKAQQDWLAFFGEHSIPENQEKKWKDEFGANVAGAKNLFTDTLSKVVEKVGKLKDTEIGVINRESPNPETLRDMINIIPNRRRAGEWDDFFTRHQADSRITDEQTKKNWIDSGMSIELADKIYANGWNNTDNGKIGKDFKIKIYTTKVDFDGKTYEKSTENIDPQKQLAGELDKVHKLIVKKIDNETVLDKFPDVKGNNLEGELTTIKNAYDESKVPDTRGYEKIRKLRDERIKKLFKDYFQGEKAANLSDEQIELWRSANTGLANDGKSQRIVFDNGWDKPNEVVGGKTKYKAVENIDVLKIKKVDIENEIGKVDKWVKEVNGYGKKRLLDEKQAEIDQVIKELNVGLLPAGKKEELTTAVEKAKTTLLYYENDPLDGGIEDSKLQTYENNIKKQWKTRNYAQFNTQILEAFINATEGIKLKPDDKWPAGNIDEWLKQKGAYKMDDTPEGKRMLENEDKLPLELRGQFLLPYLMSKVKDARNNELTSFDNLDENSFCVPGTRVEERFGRGKKEYPIIKGTQGHLPFSTGSGKSTKVIDCLLRGGGKDGKGDKDPITGVKPRKIVMVVPEQVLVDNIFKHQAGWLQTYGCVICKVPDNGVKVKKGTYTRASEEDIRNGNYEEKDIFKSHGEYKVVKNDLIPKGETGLSIINGDELIGWLDRQILIDSGEIDNWKPDSNATDWFKTQKEIDDWKAEVQSKLIDKENDIIVIDEGHFAIGSYQRAQIQAVHAKYKVIRMSATFPDMPFSITSTYPRENIFLGDKLNPKQPFGLIKIDNLEQANKLATLRGIDVSQISWKNEKGEFTPVAVNLDERLRIGKTAIFLPDENPTPQQLRALVDKDSGMTVGNIFYTPVWDPYLESMSFGMTDGSLSGLGTRHGVGINGDFDTVLLSGKMYVKNLGKRFQYGKDNLLNLDDADGVQMIGRTGRFMNGGAALMSLKWEPIDAKDDVQSAMVDAIFDGELKHIIDKGYKMLWDVAMLRMAVALPKKFGKPLAEILIGLNVDEDAEEARVKNNEKAKTDTKGKYTFQPLTKVSWRTKNDKPKKSTFFGEVDEGLWKSYLGDSEPINMDKDQAKDRLLESINTFIKEDSNFPHGIKVKNQSNLIEYVWGTDIKSNKNEVIDKIRQVLNGVVSKAIDGFKDRGVYDGINKTSKDKRVIEQISNYYQITDATIDIAMMPKVGEENKQVLTLRIEK
jgi:hypothetical protein